MELISIAVLAFFVESTVEYYNKLIVKNESGNWQCNLKMLGALTLGIIVTTIFGVDLFALVGISTVVPYVGSVLSGLIVARGANFTNDFIGFFKAGKDVRQAETKLLKDDGLTPEEQEQFESFIKA